MTEPDWLIADFSTLNPIFGPFESFFASLMIEKDACEWAKKMSLRIGGLGGSLG